MNPQVLFLLVIFGAVRALNPRLLVGVLLAVPLMGLEILDLLDVFATELAGLINVFWEVHLQMLLKPGLDSEDLVTGRAGMGYCILIMLPLVQIQCGLVPKIFVTWLTVEGCFLHVLGPYVCSEPLGVTKLMVAHWTLCGLGCNCLQQVTDILRMIVLAGVLPQTLTPINQQVVHSQGLLQIYAGGRLRYWLLWCDRLRYSGKGF